MVQCKAKSKHSGERCRRHAMRGKQVCAMHGGKTPSGFAAPSFKTGRYSRVLPARLAALYQSALADGNRLVLNDEIALCEARISDLLARVDTGESGALWETLRTAWAEMERANRDQDTARAASLYREVARLIQAGHTDTQSWRELGELIDRRARLAATEMRRVQLAHDVLTVDQAMELVTALTGAIKEQVHDRSTLAAIERAFARTLGDPDSG